MALKKELYDFDNDLVKASSSIKDITDRDLEIRSEAEREKLFGRLIKDLREYHETLQMKGQNDKDFIEMNIEKSKRMTRQW